MTRIARSAALFLLAAACSKEATAPQGATVAINSGDAQVLAVASVASPLSVLVKDASGAAMGGATVTWLVTSGGGTIAPSGLTDGNGFATAVYTAGTTSGPKIITASVGASAGASVSFNLTVAPGPARRLVRAGGDGQAAFAGAALQAPLAVTAQDTFGNGVPNVVVNWAVASGAATLGAPVSVSDTNGVAIMTVTVGAIGGVSITATASPLVGSPVAFSVTSTISVNLLTEVLVPANYGQHDQFIRAGLAFLCSWNTGLQIYDVGDGRAGGTPANPVFISSIATVGGEVHNAWWYWAPGGAKKYVFVGQEGPGSIGSSSSGDIHVVDVTNMSSPVEVAHYHMSNTEGTHNFWVDEANQVLYAAYYNGGVVALNISGTLSGDLASREIARIQPGGPGNTYVWGVQLYNGSIYVTDMLSGFWQLKLVSNVFQVAGGGNNVPERYGSDQWVANGYAYSGTWGTRNGHAGNVVKIWKLSPTGAPVLTDSIVTPGFNTVSDIEVSADNRMLMFSAEYGPKAGLYFFSLVADPGHPVSIGYFPVTSNSQSGIHTATFYEAGGKRYVFAAKDPPSPSMMVVDVTAVIP